MNRLDYTKALTAELLREIAALIGDGPALAFTRRFGGRRLYIPHRVPADHAIARCVGPEAGLRLGRELGGQAFNVPGARIYLRWLDARALRILGQSQSRIAELLNIDERHVRRMTRDFRPDEFAVDDAVRAVARHYRVKLGPQRRKRVPEAAAGGASLAGDR